MSIELIREEHHQKLFDSFMRALNEYKALTHRDFLLNRMKSSFKLPRFGIPQVVSRVEIIPSLYEHLEVVENSIPMYFSMQEGILPEEVTEALNTHMRILFPSALTFSYVRCEDTRDLYGNFLNVKKIIVDVIHEIDYSNFEFLSTSMRNRQEKISESVNSSSPAYIKVKNIINSIIDDKTFPVYIASELYNKFEKECKNVAEQYDAE